MTIRWSYALNQWNSGHDLFVLPRAHEVAFKTLSISGFEAVEIEAGSGRWEPLGRRDWIEGYYGSVAGLAERLKACNLSGVSSYIFDPGKPIFEEGAFGRSVLNRDDHPALLRTVSQFVDLLAELGGDTLVVRALPPLARSGFGLADAITVAAECWTRAGQIAAAKGVKLAMNLDASCPARTYDAIAYLLGLCDPGLVGLSVDTADLVIAGLDPRETYARFKHRIIHVQLKNTRYVGLEDELAGAAPDYAMMSAGGERRIERWYYELDDDRGLVDSVGFVQDLVQGGYDGWVVVESDQAPVPATSAMLNGWWLKRKLKPLCA